MANTIVAHVPDLMVGLRAAVSPVAVREPSSTRRKSSVTRLRLWDHSNIFMYCSRCTLFTPRNGRRKFRSPVQSPSSVLQCTSRTPSPSSSRAHSRSAWQTVAWRRPIPEGRVLQAVPEVEQLRAVAPEFARQLGGGHA